MLLGRQARALAAKGSHRLDHGNTRCGWLDDAIELSALGSQERAGHVVGVLVGELGANCRDVFSGSLGSLDLVAVKNVDRALATHNGDLGSRPCEVDVGTELLRAHNDVRATVGLTRDNRDERNGGLGVCVEQLCATANNTAPLLVGAGEVAGNVDDGQNRNRERVAEANEAARLFTGLNVEGSGHLAGLVGDDTDGTAFNARKTNDDVRREQWLNLEEVLVVNDVLDDLVHVVRLVGRVGDDRVQALVSIRRLEDDVSVVNRVLRHVVVWQERNQCACVVESIRLIAGEVVRHA